MTIIMTFLGIHIVRKNQSKFLFVRPALPAFRGCPGVWVDGPNVFVLFAFAENKLAAKE
jgi:hypothetical protein